MENARFIPISITREKKKYRSKKNLRYIYTPNTY
jgi:hypothetical protein